MQDIGLSLQPLQALPNKVRILEWVFLLSCHPLSRIYLSGSFGRSHPSSAAYI